MFKQTILAAVAVSMLAVPMAQAQSRYDGPRGNHHYSQPHKRDAWQPAPQGRHAHKPLPPRHHAQRPGPSRHHWAKGHRVPDWQRRQHVRDYHRHGLRKPSQGQQWVRVDNDYLLISLATGVILGMAAAR
jgi:Ni/Co efflux regulator RcnB